MKIQQAIISVNGFLNNQPKKLVLSFAFVSIALIGIPDYLIGAEAPFTLFYLFPVGMITWYYGRRSAAIVAIIAIFPHVAGELNGGSFVNRPGIVLWNLLLQMCTFFLFSFLLDSLLKALRKEENLSRHDSLTGLLNRRAFLERLNYSVALSVREKVAVSIAYIDIDNFKNINDKKGHEGGDNVLRILSTVLTLASRKTDIVARLGGDEFAVLLPNTKEENAQAVIHKIRNFIKKKFDEEVTCSIGCLTVEGCMIAPRTIIESVDALMYQVKKQGKDGVLFSSIKDASAINGETREPS